MNIPPNEVIHCNLIREGKDEIELSLNDPRSSFMTRCCKIIFWGLFTTIVIGIIIADIGIGQMTNKNYQNGIDTESLSPSQEPSIQDESSITNILTNFLTDRSDLLFRPGSSQYESRIYLLQHPITYEPLIKNYNELVIQRFALYTIYFAFGGESTNGIDWLQTRHECESKLVTCDDNMVIKSLFLDGVVGTLGTIPEEIGSLTNLEHLIIKNNHSLEGYLPHQIALLTNCKQLGIYNNSIEGTLPTEIGFLTDITYLNLANNELSGTLPSTIGDLTKLTKLILDDNMFDGYLMDIPLRQLQALKLLSLSRNGIGGTLPSETDYPTSLEYLYLDGNTISGMIPLTLKRLTNLKALALDFNELDSFSAACMKSLPKLEFVSFMDDTLVSQFCQHGYETSLKNEEDNPPIICTAYDKMIFAPDICNVNISTCIQSVSK